MEARYNEKLKTLEGDELAAYIAECMPFIAEYTAKSDKGVQRRNIYERYLEKVEGQSVATKTKRSHTKVCTCGSMNFVNERSDEICTECGRVEYILGEEAGFKEEQEMDKQVSYSYDRKNHFNEWLAQFQAKESTNVPPDVINLLRVEFKKQKIQNLKEITHSKVRELLKKLRLNKYYEHVPYISTVLNGINPPSMSQALEDKLRLMFGQIQAPFQKHCPAERKNFLSYSYVLYKFCELLSEDEYIKCFPLLKDKSKIYKHDQIWKKICDELRWEYIPTG
jgi:Poxvirus Late Transcription Factor VLTF3 like